MINISRSNVFGKFFLIGKLLCLISIISICVSEGLVKSELLFHKTLFSNLLHLATVPNGVVVSTLAFHAKDPGSIPPLDQQTFNFPFSPSHPSGVTTLSSLKLATSGITYPSNSQRGES